MATPRRTFLIISQVYVPDPASVGQHMADAAAELARRGNRVVVLTANRGYDDPSVRYKRTEVLDGVEIRRLSLSSFGKGSLPVRLVGALSFTFQAALRGAFVRGMDTVLVSTSPPTASLAALFVSFVRGAAIKYWVMDVNPDQAIALGLVKPGSLRARLLEALNRAVLKRAKDVIVLDRYMADRVCAKVDVRSKLSVIPPWPHEQHLEPVPHEKNPFRKRHGLDGKFVVMYSGNHSPANPVTTVLEAAKQLVDEPGVVFLFIGGGLGKAEVETADLPNVRFLPYQPLGELKYSLSAADVHVITLGNAMVGVVHPSKAYGAMAVARPILILGPEPSHLSDILGQHDVGWRLALGDVDGAERLLRALLRFEPSELAWRGERARLVVTEAFGKACLCGRFCDVVERALIPRPAAARSVG